MPKIKPFTKLFTWPVRWPWKRYRPILGECSCCKNVIREGDTIHEVCVTVNPMFRRVNLIVCHKHIKAGTRKMD